MYKLIEKLYNRGEQREAYKKFLEMLNIEESKNVERINSLTSGFNFPSCQTFGSNSSLVESNTPSRINFLNEDIGSP